MFSFLVKGSSIQKSAKKKVGERARATGGDNSVCVCVCVCVCANGERERKSRKRCLTLVECSYKVWREFFA